MVIGKAGAAGVEIRICYINFAGAGRNVGLEERRESHLAVGRSERNIFTVHKRPLEHVSSLATT